MTNEKLEKWNIEIREDPNPFLARIIIAKEWKGDPKEAKTLLENVLNKWPRGKKVKFIITCGGFLKFDWPKFISRQEVGDNLNPNGKVVDMLIKEAEKSVKEVLSEGLDKKLKDVTDYITLGIDSYKEKISTTQNYIGQLHVELVSLIDLKNNKFYWTGKSYPTSDQQNGLVRFVDLKTHFLNLEDVGKVMVLGCHDLTIFNPRSENAKGWRREVKEKFKALAKEEGPKIVLQHPHTTVKVRTWLNAWYNLKKFLPSVEIYAGAGRYYEPDRAPSEYDSLYEILEYTKCGNTLDFIVK